MQYLKFTLSAELDNQRLDKACALAFPDVSRSRIKNLILDGHVSVNETPVNDPSKKVMSGQTLCLGLPDLIPATPKAQAIALDIVYEDNDIIVINKPAGMVVHPAPGNYDSTLVNALLAHCGDTLSGIGGVARPGIVHRLDKDTSGLIVIAKNDAAHQGLSSQFADRTLSRNYYAFVWGIIKPTEGTINTNIGRSPKNRKKMSVLRVGGKHAITHYNLIKTYGNHASLVECKLETGRTHQIRVHLASIGYSIIGDEVYGKSPKGLSSNLQNGVMEILGKPARQALHAFHLQLKHPISGAPLCFNIDLPSELKNLETLLQY